MRGMPPYAQASAEYGVTCRMRSGRASSGQACDRVNKGVLHYNGPLAACSAAALAAGAVYSNAVHNPFVYDDYHTVIANASIAHVGDLRAIVLGAVTRPIVNFSYALDRALWGPAPFGFHVTSVLLHMLNVALLFRLARRVEEDARGTMPAPGGGVLAPFAAAALFAVHPMMTEAVGYVSGRSELLCATFFILALMCGRRWIASTDSPHPSGRSMEGPWAWGACTAGLWVLALAAKETAAVFPFVLLAYDRLALTAGAGGRRRRLRTIHLPLIGATIAAGVARLAIFSRIEYPGARVHWAYAFVDLDVFRRYLWLMLRPSGQTIFHEVAAAGPFDARTLLAVAVLVGLLWTIWRLRRVEPSASLGLLWFLLALLPSAGLTMLNQGEPMAEHRVYLASCGLFLAAGVAVRWLGARLDGVGARARVWSGAALALVLVSFGLETMLRNAVWRDPVGLWQESVDLAPAHFRPRLLLGESLQDAGRRDEAMEQYKTAIRLRPSDPDAYVKVGQMLAEAGRWAEARDQFHKALGVDPANAPARRSLLTLDAVESRFEPHDGPR
jgi:protein O-mannosyl-transferase